VYSQITNQRKVHFKMKDDIATGTGYKEIPKVFCKDCAFYEKNGIEHICRGEVSYVTGERIRKYRCECRNRDGLCALYEPKKKNINSRAEEGVSGYFRYPIDEKSLMTESEIKVTIRKIAKEIHECAVEKGWWKYARSIPEIKALLHSEISESFEEWRKERPFDAICYGVNGKPEGIPVELVDLLIRTFDYLVYKGRLDYLSDTWARVSLATKGFSSNLVTEFPLLIAALHAGIERSESLPAYGSIFSLIIDYFDYYKINLYTVMEIKVEYNKTRPYRHGNKRG